MKRVAFFVLVLAAALSRAGDAAAPRLEFAEKDYLFEGVMVGTPVTHAFKFKNTGNADLIIRRVDPTCGCTVSRFPRDPVKPGGEGAIELTIDTSEKMGVCLVRATVFSNDPLQNAIGPNTSLLEMKGEVTTCFKLMPLGAYFGPVIRGRQPIVREIRAPGHLDAEQGYEITAIDVPREWITVEKRPLEKTELQGGAKAGFCLKVSVLPTVPPGEFHEFVLVHTNVAKQPFFKFPVVGSATGPVKANEAVLFGQVRRGSEPERVCPVERADNEKGLPILGVEFDATRFDVKEEPVVDGVRTDLRLKVRKDAPIGPFSSYVTVRLDLPEEPLVRLAVMGDILPRVQADPPVILARPGDKEERLTVLIEKGKLLEASSDAFETKLAGNAVTLVPRRPLAKGDKLSVELKTDVPGEETVRVPVEVR